MAFYNCVKLEYHDFIQYRIYKKPIEKDYEKVFMMEWVLMKTPKKL